MGIKLTGEDNLPERRNSPATVSNRKSSKLEDKNWKKFLEDAQTLDFQQKEFSIDFWDHGEPLLHEKAVDYICKAAEAGIRCDLYTNGLLLDEKSSRRLIESGLDALFIRLDALDAETYAKINNTDPKNYEKVISNLDTFLKLKRENNDDDLFPWYPSVATIMTLYEDMNDQKIEFMKKYNRLNQLRKKFTDQGKETGRENVNVYAELYKTGKPIEHAVLREVNSFAGRIPPDEFPDYTPLVRKPCTQLFEGPYLLASGNYTICRQDIDAEHTFGSTSDDLPTLWRSKALDKIFRTHREEDWSNHPLCTNCLDWYHSYT